MLSIHEVLRIDCWDISKLEEQISKNQAKFAYVNFVLVSVQKSYQKYLLYHWTYCKIIIIPATVSGIGPD